MRKIAIFCLVLLLMGCGHVHNTTQDDDGGGEGDVALADVSSSVGSHAVVLAANWTDPIGSLAVINLSDFSDVQTALTTTDSSDAVLRSFGNYIYVINRFGADTIQVIDPKDFSVVANYSVGAGSNPQDIFIASETKAYVSRLDSQNDPENQDDVLVVNPFTGEIIYGIDLKPFTFDDGDRLARAAQMVGVGKNLFVLIQDLPSNLLDSANVSGKIAVIDMESDSVVEVIGLVGRNPSDITYSAITQKIYVIDTGVFDNFTTDVGDPYGGVEVVDPGLMQSDGIIIDDAQFGDYLMEIRLTEERGYTVVGGASVASFDMANYEVISSDLYFSAGMFVPDIAVDGDGRVLVTERDMTDSGVVILDGTSGDLLNGPIGVGALPASIAFFDVE